MSQAGSFNNSNSPGGSGILTINGITPNGSGNFNLLGAHGINVTNTGANTDTIAINNSITLGDLSPIPGLPAITLTTGDLTIAAGDINLPATSSSAAGVIKINGSPFIQAFGTNNTFVGSNAGNFTLAGANNAGFGTAALRLLGAGANNTALGAATLSSLTNGSNNIAIGNTAGNTYVGNEANNILIGSAGVVADSATTRIGTNGTQTKFFAAGIDGVNVGSVAKVVTETGDQLGTAMITAGTGITITPTANTITITASGTTNLTYTLVNTTPYVVLTTDEYLGVDSSGAPIQINLPNAPATGRVYIIKDRTGSAATNNITVTTVGGAVLIDGATTFVMNTAFEAIEVIFNGTFWEIF